MKSMKVVAIGPNIVGYKNKLVCEKLLILNDSTIASITMKGQVKMIVQRISMANMVQT